MAVSFRDVVAAFRSFHQDGAKKNKNRAQDDKYSIGLENFFYYHFKSNVEELTIRVKRPQLKQFLEAISSSRLSTKYNITEIQNDRDSVYYLVREASVLL